MGERNLITKRHWVLCGGIVLEIVNYGFISNVISSQYVIHCIGILIAVVMGLCFERLNGVFNDAINDSFNDVKQHQNNCVKTMVNALNDLDKENKAEMKLMHQSIVSEMGDCTKAINEELHLIKNYQSKAIETLESQAKLNFEELSASLKEQKEENVELFNEKQKILISYVDEKNTSVLEQIKVLDNSINESVHDLKSGLNEKLVEVKKNMDSDYDELKNSLSANAVAMQNNYEGLLAVTKAVKQEVLDQQSKEMATLESQTKLSFEELRASLKEQKEENVELFNEKQKILISYVDEKNTSVLEQIKELDNSINESVNKFKSGLNEKLIEVQKNMESDYDELKNSLSANATAMQNNYEGLLAVTREVKQDVLDQQSKEIATLESQTKLSFEELRASLKEQKEENVELLNEKQKILTSYVDEKNTSVLEQIKVLDNSINESVSELKSGLNEKLVEVKKNMDSDYEELNSSLSANAAAMQNNHEGLLAVTREVKQDVFENINNVKTSVGNILDQQNKQLSEYGVKINNIVEVQRELNNQLESQKEVFAEAIIDSKSEIVDYMLHVDEKIDDLEFFFELIKKFGTLSGEVLKAESSGSDTKTQKEKPADRVEKIVEKESNLTVFNHYKNNNLEFSEMFSDSIKKCIVYYDEYGSIVKGINYDQNGAPTMETEYYPSGQLKQRTEIFVKNGELNKVVKNFDENGNMI